MFGGYWIQCFKNPFTQHHITSTRRRCPHIQSPGLSHVLSRVFVLTQYTLSPSLRCSTHSSSCSRSAPKGLAVTRASAPSSAGNLGCGRAAAAGVVSPRLPNRGGGARFVTAGPATGMLSCGGDRPCSSASHSSIEGKLHIVLRLRLFIKYLHHQQIFMHDCTWVVIHVRACASVCVVCVTGESIKWTYDFPIEASEMVSCSSSITLSSSRVTSS